MFRSRRYYQHDQTSINRIRSGDLLAWSKGSDNIFSKTLVALVKFVTRSKYGHVGIAWILGGRLVVVDASIPRVRMIAIRDLDEFYHIPLKIRWNRQREAALMEHVGQPYSIMDCLRAFLGRVTEDDDHWQCAELCTDFYTKAGFELQDTYTPAKLVNAFVIENGYPINRVRKFDSTSISNP
jgi:hypothetical protein